LASAKKSLLLAAYAAAFILVVLGRLMALVVLKNFELEKEFQLLLDNLQNVLLLLLTPAAGRSSGASVNI
jgi:hypothetical protein